MSAYPNGNTCDLTANPLVRLLDKSSGAYVGEESKCRMSIDLFELLGFQFTLIIACTIYLLCLNYCLHYYICYGWIVVCKFELCCDRHMLQNCKYQMFCIWGRQWTFAPKMLAVSADAPKKVLFQCFCHTYLRGTGRDAVLSHHVPHRVSQDRLLLSEEFVLLPLDANVI
jgi:hypothetical protein